jgi:uncharacterized protein
MATVIKVDVAPVLWAGRDLVFEQAVSVPDFVSYTFSEPAVVLLKIRRLNRGLDISGTIEAAYAGACDRCLGDVHRTMYLDIEEQFSAEAKSADPFADSNVLSGTTLDVSDLVRQLIDSALPLTILCSEECRGLCARCGQNAEICRCLPAK